MVDRRHDERADWRPQARFHARISSKNQLQSFNDFGGIAVHIDIARAVRPSIEIIGSQSEKLSFWETRSESGFVTRPKFNESLLTVRFVMRGHFIYAGRGRAITGSPTHATLANFEDLVETRASRGASAVSGTIAVDTLVAAQRALTGNDEAGLPQLAPVADMELPGLVALFHSVRHVQQRVSSPDQQADGLMSFVKEIINYQLLSAWPKRSSDKVAGTSDVPPSKIGSAIDYIEENLSSSMTLAEISAAAGSSVRSLQSRFKHELGKTPLQYVIERRLIEIHRELLLPQNAARSIAEIARRWGFVHMNDFTVRYRRLYGCTPTESRRGAIVGLSPTIRV